MDEAISTVFRNLALLHECSADQVVTSPELREAFLVEARRSLGDLPEQTLLQRLLYLRKHSRLPRLRDLILHGDHAA